MAKRKRKIKPVAPAIVINPEGDVLGPTARSLLIAEQALGDIPRLNTARKCHDRVRQALAAMEDLDP